MIDEIKSAVESESAWVSAVSLVCATKIAGRESHRLENPNKKPLNSTETFNHFLIQYMDCNNQLKEFPRIYDDFRNGLVHEGFPKSPEEGGVSFGFSGGILDEPPRGIYCSDSDRSVYSDVLLMEFIEGEKNLERQS